MQQTNKRRLRRAALITALSAAALGGFAMTADAAPTAPDPLRETACTGTARGLIGQTVTLNSSAGEGASYDAVRDVLGILAAPVFSLNYKLSTADIPIGVLPDSRTVAIGGPIIGDAVAARALSIFPASWASDSDKIKIAGKIRDTLTKQCGLTVEVTNATPPPPGTTPRPPGAVTPPGGLPPVPPGQYQPPRDYSGLPVAVPGKYAPPPGVAYGTPGTAAPPTNGGQVFTANRNAPYPVTAGHAEPLAVDSKRDVP